MGSGGAVVLAALAVLCTCRRTRQRRRQAQALKEALLEDTMAATVAADPAAGGRAGAPSDADEESPPARPDTVATSAAGFTTIYDAATAVRLLGRGNSGSVYLMSLEQGGGAAGRTCVCKRCPMEEALTDEDRHALYHEVRILSALSHPHIIQYLHAARHEGELRIYMEYAEGGTMAQAIKAQAARRAPFAAARLVAWLRQLTSALRHVHAECVLHRDLKTANIFLSRDGDVKLGDFGISRALSTYTHFASTMVGTPYTMAPEVLDSVPYAHAADVWALGVVAFELLTLRRPFDGAHLGALVARISRGQYDEAALAASPHPAALRRLASRECLLHPDPEQRMRLPELDEALADGTLL